MFIFLYINTNLLKRFYKPEAGDKLLTKAYFMSVNCVHFKIKINICYKTC